MSFFSLNVVCLSFYVCLWLSFLKYFYVVLMSLFFVFNLWSVYLMFVCFFSYLIVCLSLFTYCLFEYFSMLMSTLIYSFIRCLSLLFGWVMIFCLSLRQTVIYALVLVSLKLCYGLLAFLCHFFSFCTCLFDCRSLICLSSCLFCLFNCLSFNVVSVCLTLFVCLKFLHWKLQQASW